MSEKYAAAESSALRTPINQTLLEVLADGTYEKIHATWFEPRK